MNTILVFVIIFSVWISSIFIPYIMTISMKKDALPVFSFSAITVRRHIVFSAFWFIVGFISGAFLGYIGGILMPEYKDCSSGVCIMRKTDVVALRQLTSVAFGVIGIFLGGVVASMKYFFKPRT